MHLVTVMELPPQLPTQASVMSDISMALLLSAVEYAESRRVNATAEAISARSAAEAIIQSAISKECDLIVMGSSQRTMTEKVLFGNIVDLVLKSAPCDVIVLSYTNDLKPISYKKILVPTSGYLHATRALEISIGLEKKFKGSITSLYVGDENDAAGANAILGRVNKMAEGAGVSHSSVFLTGNVVDNIVNTAKDGDYDLLIIGATERPRQYKQLLGSSADEIVKRAPCNVLIVRTKKTR
jgi:nucleotide-binding universal stress UspA family protein